MARCVGARWPGKLRNARAIREVLSGEEKVANAAWWGFDEEDATEALQAAINSGAETVIVPNMGMDWNVRPITLVGDQELIVERGAVIAAKRGEYRGPGDSVLTARNIANLTIRGYGGTVRMHKEDYIVGKVLADLGWDRWFGPYQKAEWRMALSLMGCTNVQIYGITLRDSGGDGIYIGTGNFENPCKNIYLKDVICDNNYRQGISIINVEGLLAENSVFQNTWGTPPSSGVDIEPDSPNECIKDVVFRNCLFKDNYGDGIEVYLSNLKAGSEPVSILFDSCRVTSSWGSGIRVSKVADDGPGGLIEFRDCVVEDTQGYGIKVQDKSAHGARVRFVRCRMRNVAGSRSYRGAWTPIWLQLYKPGLTRTFGGIDLVDCLVEDEHDRPALTVQSEFGIFEIAGTISIRNPFGIKTDLGQRKEGVTLATVPWLGKKQFPS